MAKEFIVVVGNDQKVSGIVTKAFQDYNGRVPLGELEKRLYDGLNFNPLIRLNEEEDNQQLNTYRGLDYQVYELIGGTILYR